MMFLGLSFFIYQGSCCRVLEGLFSANIVHVYMSLCLKRAGAMVAAATPMEVHCWAHLRLHIPWTWVFLLTFWSKR